MYAWGVSDCRLRTILMSHDLRLPKHAHTNRYSYVFCLLLSYFICSKIYSVVRIDSNNMNNSFKGILVQGRQQADGTSPLGTVIVLEPSTTKLSACTPPAVSRAN